MKLELKKINKAINAISNSIDTEQYEEALFGCNIMQKELEKHTESDFSRHLYFNLAAQLIDVGTFLKRTDTVLKG